MLRENDNIEIHSTVLCHSHPLKWFRGSQIYDQKLSFWVCLPRCPLIDKIAIASIEENSLAENFALKISDSMINTKWEFRLRHLWHVKSTQRYTVVSLIPPEIKLIDLTYIKNTWSDWLCQVSSNFAEIIIHFT